MKLDKHTNAKFNTEPVYIIKQNGTEKWRRHYYIDFSVDNTEYGSWDNSTQLELPYGTTYSTNTSNGSITFTKPDGSTLTRSINKTANALATASATTGYCYYFNNFNIGSTGTITSDLSILGSLTRKANYWVTFSKSGEGSVTSISGAVEEGEVVTVSSNQVSVSRLTSNASKETMQCTASASSQRQTSGTHDDQNTSTGIWKKTPVTHTYTPAFSSWDISNSSKITAPTTITATFTTNIQTAYGTEYIYGYYIQLNNSYNGSTVNCNGNHSVTGLAQMHLYKSDGSTLIKDRLAIGDTGYFWAEGTKFILNIKSLAQYTVKGTKRYFGNKLYVNGVQWDYKDSNTSQSKNYTISPSGKTEFITVGLGRDSNNNVSNVSSGTTTAGTASGTVYPSKSSGTITVSGSWDYTLPSVPTYASVKVGWRGTNGSFTVYNGSWSGSTKVSYNSSSYITVTKIEYTQDSITATANKNKTLSTNYTYTVSAIAESTLP